MRKNEKGFTLLEVMVALSVLALGVLALMRGMPAFLRGSKTAEEYTIATMLAQQKMDEFRAYYAGPEDTWAELGTDGSFAAPYDKYEWEWGGYDPYPVIWYLTVSVWWPADKGSPGNRDNQRVVNLVTYVAVY